MDYDLGRIVEENRKATLVFDEALVSRIEEARSSLPHLRDAILQIDPSVRRIVLFGSLATDSVRDLEFDIDIAVSGERVFKLAAWGEDQAIPVDIVDYDALVPEFRAEVDRQGVLLYAKPQ